MRREIWTRWVKRIFNLILASSIRNYCRKKTSFAAAGLHNLASEFSSHCLLSLRLGCKLETVSSCHILVTADGHQRIVTSHSAVNYLLVQFESLGFIFIRSLSWQLLNFQILDHDKYNEKMEYFTVPIHLQNVIS